MDKYTVDLDQVLNDFEYLELTDQHSRNNNVDTKSKQYDNLEAQKQSTAAPNKHSINNVFNSLNEYLNSDISSATTTTNLESPLKLEIEENTQQQQAKEIYHSAEYLTNDKEDETVNKLKLPEDLDNPIVESLESDDSKTIITEQLQLPSSENFDNSILIKTENLVDVVGNDDEGSCDNNNDSVNCLLTKEEESNRDSKDQLDYDENETISKEIETIEDKILEQENDKNNQAIAIIEIDQINDDNKLDDTNNYLEMAAPPSEPKQSSAEQIIDNDNDLVRFSYDIDMNDEELDQMLEQLESEHLESDSDVDKCDIGNETIEKPLKKMEENKSIVLEESAKLNDQKNDDDLENADKKKEELVNDGSKESSSLQRPQDLPILGNDEKELNAASGGRKIDLIGSPGSTPYNNVYINESILETTENHHQTITDSIDNKDERDKLVASPTLSDSSTTTTDSSAGSYGTGTGTTTSSTASIDDAAPPPLPERDRNKKIEEVEEDDDNSTSTVYENEIIVNAVKNNVEVSTVLENSENSVIVCAASGAINTEPPNEDEIPNQNINNSDEAAAAATAVPLPPPPPPPQTTFAEKSWLGKEAPLWIPDSHAACCLQCGTKFTVLKRRHHCRACGLVLCSKCCNMKFRLEYLDAEARVCNQCHDLLNKDAVAATDTHPSSSSSVNPDDPSSSELPLPSVSVEVSSNPHRPNPNNPSEYCSTISPFQQVAAEGRSNNNNPPSVMVPVGVLKRKGAIKKSNKSVMFCDGIAPGSDLTHLDQDFNYNPSQEQKAAAGDGDALIPEETTVETKKIERGKKGDGDSGAAIDVATPAKLSKNEMKIDPETGCFIPKSTAKLPPIVTIVKTDISYSDIFDEYSNLNITQLLQNKTVMFAINQNLFVHVRIINMNCCINKIAWCFTTEGLINVGSDEFIYLLEFYENENSIPKDLFFHIHSIYLDAVKGNSIKELGLSLHNTSSFLNSKNHAGFVYLKPTFQCLENVIKPKEPYLIGILIHRWETPWAKLFPLRLILRLGAEYRYYPSPIISSRYRDSVFVEIGHTIINLLADFRNFTYSLSQIRGLVIHMEEKKSTLMIPKNRYEQVIKTINNSSESILAFAGNFSGEADSHLVCIQDTQGHENCYTTHAINIHNKPRQITGASFIVFNGSLKTSSGLTAKSNIVEDGLMIQVPSEHMDKIRESLRSMKNHSIPCGCINAQSDEIINIVWCDNDNDFNIGVRSPIDDIDLKGMASIRVHNAKDYYCNSKNRFIRWTEVFILQNGDENNGKNQEPIDISKVSESIAKACCLALVKYLDLLVTNSFQKIAIRTTLHVDNVSYWAGSNGIKLPPIYMRSLDNELIPVLHKISSNSSIMGNNTVVLELFFRILNA